MSGDVGGLLATAGREKMQRKISDEMRWVPVSERLPEIDRPVLVYTAEPSMGVARRYPLAWNLETGGLIGGITYWMPLPPPPAGEPLSGPLDEAELANIALVERNGCREDKDYDNN